MNVLTIKINYSLLSVPCKGKKKIDIFKLFGGPYQAMCYDF